MFSKFCGTKNVLPKYKREPGTLPEEQRKSAKSEQYFSLYLSSMNQKF